MSLKKKLLEKSEHLFFRYGIRSVAMDDLARELGVSKKTLYQHVENKTALVKEIFAERSKEEMEQIALLQKEAQDAIDEVISVARYMINRFRAFTPTMRYDLQKYYREIHLEMEELHKVFFQELIFQNIMNGQADKLYRANIEPETVARFFTRMAIAVGDIEHFPAKDFTLDKLLRQLFHYHINGLASPKGLSLLSQYLETNKEENW